MLPHQMETTDMGTIQTVTTNQTREMVLEVRTVKKVGQQMMKTGMEMENQKPQQHLQDQVL